MSTKKKIRFGVIGCSRIAEKAAVPALLDSELAELVIVGSRSLERARVCAEKFDCDSFGTYEEVLARADIDAVYISLPNSLHEEWTLKAASAGKHVWCEKPAALTYASAKTMVAACRANNVRLMEGFMFLSHPQHAKVRDIIHSGTIGDVTGLMGRIAYPKPDERDIRLDPALGGGIYFDALVYPIRASRMIFDAEPLTVSCTMTLDPRTGVDVQDEAILTFPETRTAVLSGEFTEDYRSTYCVVGTKGSIRMERAYAVPKDMMVKIFLDIDGTVQEIAIPPADHFKLMIDGFCSELLSNVRTKNYEDDLLAQARVLDAGRMSHAERRIVDLSELAA